MSVHELAAEFQEIKNKMACKRAQRQSDVCEAEQARLYSEGRDLLNCVNRLITIMERPSAVAVEFRYLIRFLIYFFLFVNYKMRQ